MLYATTDTRRIVAIDPSTGSATATKIHGMFLAIDQIEGKALYTAFQPEIEDVLVIKELSKGRFIISEGVMGSRALLAKLTIEDKQLRIAGVNANAAANGYLVRISPDGQRVAVVGGGGYRSRPGAAPGKFPT